MPRRLRVSRLRSIIASFSAGAYTWSGSNANFVKARHLVAQLTGGQYTWGGQSAVLTYTATATGVTVSGPVAGTVGVASSNFIAGVTPVGGNFTSPLTVTPSDSGAGGTFTPPSVSLTTATPTATFTYTALNAGSKTISFANNRGLSNPANIVFVASPAGSIPTTGVAVTSLTVATTQTAPFVFGQVFKLGDVAAGSSFSGLQTTVVNSWPDGSVKFAIIAGTVALTAGTPRPIGMQVGSPAGGSSLSTTNLKAQLTQVVTIGCGAFGVASWAGTDWDSPFANWVSGPVMSSWIYKKAVGSESHLTAWLEVRLFSTGAVEILPWLENGFIDTASPATTRTETYTFVMGGTTRFSGSITLLANQRAPLVSGTLLSHWLAADPLVVVKHDAAYMQSTDLVPSYFATVAPSATVVTGQPATFTPLQLGSYTANMADTGYHADIGPLPEWDMLYLTCTAPELYSSVIRNGYSAGRWQFHYRDRATNRPLRFSQWPNLRAGLSPAGASQQLPVIANGWDRGHQPSMGYMPYLLTGRYYFMDEVVMNACGNYLDTSVNSRSGALGILQSADSTRAAAWSLRTLAHATTVLADSDTALRTEFITVLENNVNYYHTRYIAGPSHPFGVVEPYFGDDQGYGTPGDGVYISSAFMLDFFTCAVGYMLAMNPPIQASVKTKLQAFFAWKAKLEVGRLGTSAATDWLYRDAGVSRTVVALVDAPDFAGGTGPWPSNMGQMYDATFAGASPGPRVDGDLRGGYYPSAGSYWGNLLGAIAYALHHNVSGALVGYNRMIGASNWSQLVTDANTTPVWSLKPRVMPALVPTWLNGIAVNQWVEISGTSLATVGGSMAGGGAVDTRLDAWCGFVRRNTQLFLVAGGGHNDYYGNEVLAIDLSANTPAWTVKIASSPLSAVNVAISQSYYSDGRPASSHLYWTQHWIPERDWIVSHGMGATATQGAGSNACPVYDAANNVWLPANTVPNAPVTTQSEYAVFRDPVTGNVYRGYNFGAERWNQLTNTWSGGMGGTSTNFLYGAASAVDSTRRRALLSGGDPAKPAPVLYNFATNVFSDATITGEPPFFRNNGQWGFDYCPTTDCYYALYGTTAGPSIYQITAGGLVASLMTTTGGSALPSAINASGGYTGVYRRFQYINLGNGVGGIAYEPAHRHNIWFLRLH